MKIKKFNENSTDSITGIFAIVTIPVDKRHIPFDDLIKDSYYIQYEKDYKNDKKSLIQYTIEHIILEEGLLNFSYKLVDEFGKEITTEELYNRIELNDSANKFNL